MMIRCDRAMLDTDQGILFCDDGGPCGKRLHCGDCPLVTQKEEKEFEIGQRVRIIGPTIKGAETYVGECFTIDQMLVSTDKIHGYSRHDRNHVFPASSLELVRSESDRLDEIEKRLDSIEKRLQPPEALTIIPGFKIVYPNSNIAKEWDLGSKGHSTATEEFQSFEGVPAPDEPPELHVGNYVEVVGQPFVVSGLPVGTIDRVSYQAPFGWFTLEGSEAWYPLRSLRKLSDEEIIAKIGWERKA